MTRLELRDPMTWTQLVKLKHILTQDRIPSLLSSSIYFDPSSLYFCALFLSVSGSDSELTDGHPANWRNVQMRRRSTSLSIPPPNYSKQFQFDLSTLIVWVEWSMWNIQMNKTSFISHDHVKSLLIHCTYTTSEGKGAAIVNYITGATEYQILIVYYLYN